MSSGPQVVRRGVLDMQVCVSDETSDGEVVAFAETENPCGTQYGWSVRREGSPLLSGSPERVDCHERVGYVHIMLNA